MESIASISRTPLPGPSLAQSLAAGIAEEARETLAETKLEALQGDRLARQRLAAINAQAAAAAAAPQNLPESTGKLLNVKA